VAVTCTEEQLMQDLVPAFRDRAGGYRLHGQVCAGWYRVDDARGGSDAVAVSLQIVSSRVRRQQWRLGLNVVGRGPRGEPLENLFDRLGAIPWAGPARWAQEALGQIEQRLNRQRRGANPQVKRRLDGVLGGLARRLEKDERVTQRLTRHAETRRRQRQRPTDKALSDLAAARDDQILFDGRHETLIVLGDKGRAHVFNQAGKLVTSIHYSTASISRRRKTEKWRNASPEEIVTLRSQGAKWQQDQG
jgi:hypothetical protein